MGGVYTTYAHIMPALLLKNVIPYLCGDKKNMHVLCMGWKFNFSKDCWLNSSKYNADTGSNLVIDAIMESNALREINDRKFITEVEIGKHQRIVVWLLEDKHAFAVGWNIYRESSDKFQCCVFEINSAKTTDFVRKINGKLPDKLTEFYGPINKTNLDSKLSFIVFSDFALSEKETSSVNGGGVVPNFSNQIITPSDIGAPTDFPCVPFMARCTMYLSFINDLTEAHNISDLGMYMDLYEEKNLYSRFETCCIDIMDKIVTSDRHCLLVPPAICDKKIININDIHLEEFDPENSYYIKVVEFFGFDQGFLQWLPGGGSRETIERPLHSPCIHQAHYPSTPALSAIRECRMLLSALMLRR